MFSRLIHSAVLLVIPVITHAYNNSFEERIANQLSQGEHAGEVVWLQTGKGRFISLYRDYNTDQPQGAAILLHGMGAHPDWPEIVHPLRTALPELGWATLSIQLPVLPASEPVSDYGLTMPESRLRIQAAIRQLRDWRFLNIVVIGYSFGAATAASALGSGEIDRVKALVGISMQAQQFLNPRLKLVKEIESINIPVLDIYGSRDMLEVRREADDRRLAARKNGNSAYQQMVIEGADHYFTGLVEVLIKRIQGWLVKVSPGSSVRLEEEATEGGESKGASKNPD